MKSHLIVLALATATLVGCAAESKAPPVSAAGSGGASSQAPQPANALPRGSAINGPLDPPTGNIGSTRVGPSRPNY